VKNLFGEEIGRPRATRTSSTTRKSKTSDVLGCEHCTLNHVSGVHKIINIDRITGRKIMVWAQSPEDVENSKGLELVGPSGQFLWTEFKDYGITRDDCDIQNVCRCQPRTSTDGNTPTKAQLKSCSIYNQQALDRNRSQAVVHLILGKIAGVQLLGKAYSKAKAAIWHEPWNAYVVVADHPARILRSGGKKAGWLYYAFRDKLKAVKAIVEHPGRWGYVNAQDYGAVMTPNEMEDLKEQIRSEADAGRRVSVDIEDGTVDGKKVVLMIGFAWGQYVKRDVWDGQARSVVLYHPEAPQTKSRLQPLLSGLKDILEDPTILKVMQHGSYDQIQTYQMLGIRIRGYDFDTQYGSYLWHPHLRTYGLDSQAGYFFQEFADYKQMVQEWSGNYANAPLDRLVTYNCGDADLTKRIEVKSKDKINHALLQVYIAVAFTLEKMEKRGPFLDYQAHAKLNKFVGGKVQHLKTLLKQAAGDPEFNPNTPQQVAKLLFDKLQMPQLSGRSTGKEILETLEVQTGSKIPRLELDYRMFSKMESTYLIGFMKSAELYNGQLHTIWWLTGAATGRLRSGKGDRGELEGIINFQNLHGNPLLQNLLVSDPNWRLALE